MKSDRIFADTNLFLRYLTNDVPDQADAVESLLRRAANGEFTLVTSTLVLAEIIWTLQSYYHLSPLEIQKNVLAILNTPGLEVVDGELVLQAILWYVEKNVDFIDAFHVAWLSKQNITAVSTFDRKHFERFDEIDVSVPGAV